MWNNERRMKMRQNGTRQMNFPRVSEEDASLP